MAKRITLNQIGVMIEALNDKVDAMGEGQRSLENKVDGLGNRFVGLESKVDRLDKKIDVVHTSLKNEIKSTFYALNDKLDEHLRQPSHAG